VTKHIPVYITMPDGSQVEAKTFQEIVEASCSVPIQDFENMKRRNYETR